MGFSVATSWSRRDAGRAVHTNRPEPGWNVRVSPTSPLAHSVAAEQPPHTELLALRCSCGGGGLSLHRAVHGRGAGVRNRTACRASIVDLCGAGVRYVLAVSRGQLGAGRFAPAAAPWPLDGHVSQADGLPMF